jgi:hypothetical protein
LSTIPTPLKKQSTHRTPSSKVNHHNGPSKNRAETEEFDVS